MGRDERLYWLRRRRRATTIPPEYVGRTQPIVVVVVAVVTAAAAAAAAFAPRRRGERARAPAHADGQWVLRAPFWGTFSRVVSAFRSFPVTLARHRFPNHLGSRMRVLLLLLLFNCLSYFKI